jgi:hypothetical protein
MRKYILYRIYLCISQSFLDNFLIKNGKGCGIKVGKYLCHNKFGRKKNLTQIKSKKLLKHLK